MASRDLTWPCYSAELCLPLICRCALLDLSVAVLCLPCCSCIPTGACKTQGGTRFLECAHCRCVYQLAKQRQQARAQAQAQVQVQAQALAQAQAKAKALQGQAQAQAAPLAGPWPLVVPPLQTLRQATQELEAVARWAGPGRGAALQ